MKCSVKLSTTLLNKTFHTEDVLKYRELSNDNTGSNNYGYRSKLHEGIVPSIIRRAGKVIVVNDNVVLIRERKKEKSTLSTPIKVVACSDCNQVESGIDPNLLNSDEKCDTKDAFTEKQQILPKVLNLLFECGKLNSYMKFNKLIHEEKVSINNFCFLLFNDLVEWFSCTNTSHMTYQKKTIQFCRLGYRLFHGKFIRFMSGLRNFGQVLDDKGDRGYLGPEDSKVNFAVPALNNLKRKDNKTNRYSWGYARNIYRGFNNDTIK